MISRDSFAIASYSGPLADIAASFCSTDAATLACMTGLPIAGFATTAAGAGGGGVTRRWRGGGVATRARASSGIAGPVERSVDVHVSRIRQKIEPDAGDPTFIKTIRLGGYIFTPEVKPA